MRTPTFRADSTTVQIRCYSPGDGRLSFIAVDVRTGTEVLPPPTPTECRKVCPYGWLLYEEGGTIKARPMEV